MLPSRFQGLSFSANSNPIWLTNVFDYFEPFTYPTDPSFQGEQAEFYAVHDTDGSIMASPGFIVANNPFLVPPPGSAGSCVFHTSWNAYACRGVCYRSVAVQYPEVGFSARGNNTHGQYR